MKPGSIKPVYILVAVFVAAASLVLISWGGKQDSTRFHEFRTNNDTTPQKSKTVRDRKVRDLDEALEEVDNIDLKNEIENAMKSVSEAMKNFDGEKIRMDVEKAMKEVDFDKIKIEIDKAMKEVNFEKINQEIKESLKEVDMEKIKTEINESMAKINWDEMKKEMAKVKEIDMKGLETEMKKVAEEMKELKPKLEKEMAKAKVEIEKAKTELKEYKGFVDGLDKDGLINKKEPYTIKHKNGELIINGKKASDQVYTKYRSFLEKHTTFSIKKTEDDFDMDTDSDSDNN